MKTKLFVRDKYGIAQGEIYDFDQFDGIIRRRNVGSWSIKLPSTPSDPRAEQNPAEELAKPGAGIIVERDGEELMTGAMTQTEPKWSVDEDQVIISGLTDEQILWDQVVYPGVPDFTRTDGKLFPDDAYDVREGIAETIMKAYVRANFAAEDRRVPGLDPVGIAADLARGISVIGRGRFQYLGDLLVELATAGGDLGFGMKNFVFDVSEPRDLRRNQVFSIESGNLESYDFKRTAPKATDVWNAGGGEKEERVFVRRRDVELEKLWSRHIEVFKDRRDTSDLTELAQSGDQALIDGAEVTQVDLRAIDVPNRAFGVDWLVGDYVTVQGIDAVVREAKITLDQNGETVTPTIDSVTTVTAQSMIQLYDAVRSLKRQINDLQRTR